MSTLKEHSLDSFLDEIRELKESMEKVLPSYTNLLKDLSSLPKEFECRFWVSCLEALVEKVRVDYESFQAEAMKVDLLNKLMTLGMDMALMARGVQPVAPPPPVQIGVAISSSGRIRPDYFDNPNRGSGAIFVAYEEFMAIAHRLKEKLLKGAIVPTREEEIPRLVYSQALELRR